MNAKQTMEDVVTDVRTRQEVIIAHAQQDISLEQMKPHAQVLLSPKGKEDQIFTAWIVWQLKPSRIVSLFA